MTEAEDARLTALEDAEQKAYLAYLRDMDSEDALRAWRVAHVRLHDYREELGLWNHPWVNSRTEN